MMLAKGMIRFVAVADLRPDTQIVRNSHSSPTSWRIFVSILNKLGHDTVARLLKASALRFDEADHLREGGFHLGSIYLAGYAAELAIGSGYYQTVLGYGPHRKIVADDLRTLLRRARQLSELDDQSHPIDGLAQLLIEDKSAFDPPGFGRKYAELLEQRVELIARNWGPKLRYRSIEVSRHEADSVLEAVRWIMDHRPDH